MTNVKLETSAHSIPLFGELAIGDYLVSEANKVPGAKKLPRLTTDLVFDHWAYYLNNHLRETVHNYLVNKTSETKELLKR